jgi:hypothetical protein
LHENADITWFYKYVYVILMFYSAMKDTEDLFNNLLSIQPSTGVGVAGKSREEIIQEQVLKN